jgi:hypothetical protein
VEVGERLDSNPCGVVNSHAALRSCQHSVAAWFSSHTARAAARRSLAAGFFVAPRERDQTDDARAKAGRAEHARVERAPLAARDLARGGGVSLGARVAAKGGLAEPRGVIRYGGEVEGAFEPRDRRGVARGVERRMPSARPRAKR